MSAQQALPLPSAAPPNTVVINSRCSLRDRGGRVRAIVVAGLTVHRYCAEDAVAEAHAMVFIGGAGLRPANRGGARVCPIGAHRAAASKAICGGRDGGGRPR